MWPGTSSRLETPINIVMYDGEHEQIKQYLESVTGKRTMNIILIKDDLSHIYAISEALSAMNWYVCTPIASWKAIKHFRLISWGSRPGSMGPFLLAAKFKVPVSFVFAVKANCIIISSPAR